MGPTDAGFPSPNLNLCLRFSPRIVQSGGSGGYTVRSSTSKKANRPMEMRSSATATTGDCIPSFFTPTMEANDSLYR
jgi:hypothetical protein